jgi:glycopeptide antibiotics resistance protein
LHSSFPSAFRIHHSALWPWWIAVVLLVSSPWVGFTSEPQWHRVSLIPFTDPADKVKDLAANILLFIPFGYSAAGWRRARSGFVFAVAAAAAVSIVAEASQLFSTRRYPSATDVTAAVMGAVVGAGVQTLLGRISSKPKLWTV